ncbi:MAG TPA: tetratricopeptide repeat protein [Candidatus Didemnitutus sp.]|nr:tetratricopeptide repeat protein [Candidatus Didemnitutus sp.]
MHECSVATLEDRLQKQVESARTAFGRGNFDVTVELCSAVLREVPACLPVRKLHRAALVRRTRAPQTIMGTALDAITRAPFMFSGAAQKEREPLQLMRRAEELLETDPHDPAALLMVAEAATALGWKETAVFAYEAVRERAPGDEDNLILLGRALIAAGRPVEAVKVAEQAVRLEPTSAPALNLLKDSSAAAAMLEGNWEQDGSFRNKLRGSRAPLGSRAPFPAPAPIAMQVEALAPDLRELYAFVRQYPKDPVGRMQLANKLREAGQCDSAIVHFQVAATSPGTRAAALLGLGRCYADKGQLDLAIIQLESAKAEVKEMGSTKKTILYELGCCHEAEGHLDQAIQEFKVVYQTDPGYRDVADRINRHFAKS